MAVKSTDGQTSINHMLTPIHTITATLFGTTLCTHLYWVPGGPPSAPPPHGITTHVILTLEGPAKYQSSPNIDEMPGD